MHTVLLFQRFFDSWARCSHISLRNPLHNQWLCSKLVRHTNVVNREFVCCQIKPEAIEFDTYYVLFSIVNTSFACGYHYISSVKHSQRLSISKLSHGIIKIFVIATSPLHSVYRRNDMLLLQCKILTFTQPERNAIVHYSKLTISICLSIMKNLLLVTLALGLLCALITADEGLLFYLCLFRFIHW